MKKQLQVSVVSINDAVRFHAFAPEKKQIVLDCFSLPEDEEGYSSLELLLISAASCLATVVKLMARRRLNENSMAVEIEAVGIRRDEMPTDFLKMTFSLRCESAHLEQHALESLVRTAKERMCPVFAMLRSDIETEISATVIRPGSKMAALEGGER